MFSDDLVFRIPLDTPGTEIPGGDAAIRIQVENCIISNTLNEQVEVLGDLADSATRPITLLRRQSPFSRTRRST